MRPFLALGLFTACKGCFTSCFNPGLPPDPPVDTQEEETETEDSPVDTTPPEDTTPPPPCDQPEVEPNYNTSVANEIVMESFACGNFGEKGDFDVFTFSMPEGGWLKIDVDAADRGSEADPVMNVESQRGYNAAVYRGATSNDPLLVVPVAKSDVWTVYMTDGYQGFGEDHDYRFLASTTKPPTTWTDMESEDHSTWETAQPIAVGQRIFGVVDSATEYDWYAFTTPIEKSTVGVKVQAQGFGSPLTPRLQLYFTKEGTDGLPYDVLQETWDKSSASASLDPDFTRAAGDGSIWYLKVRYRPETPYGDLYWYIIEVEVTYY